MIQSEIDRLAASVNALRPDWPANSLRTFIANNLADRAYRDAALAFAWIATDADTRTPARILEAGPWWTTTRPASTPGPGSYEPNCANCGYPESAHSALNHGPWRDVPCAYTPPRRPALDRTGAAS